MSVPFGSREEKLLRRRLVRTQADLVRGPIAHIANVNAIVKQFKLHLIYCTLGCGRPVPAGKILLQGFILDPFYSGDIVAGECVPCQGGRFKPYTLSRRHILTERVRGTKFMTKRTKFIQGILRPGAIGRIQLDKVVFGRSPKVVRVAQTCLGADTGALNFGGTLPLIPCNQRVPNDPSASFLTPYEVSSTQDKLVEVSGHLTGQRWISLFRIHGPCGPDAQATARKYHQLPALMHVSGPFTKFFGTGTDTQPGNFCVYAQLGQLYQKVPDGRLTLVGSHVFYAGDRVAIVGPTSVGVGGTATDDFVGHASTTETLWIFTAAQPCAASAEAEYPPSFGFSHVAVTGDFSTPETSAPLPSSSFRCAYLQLGAPTSQGLPTGPTLAAASQLVTVF